MSKLSFHRKESFIKLDEHRDTNTGWQKLADIRRPQKSPRAFEEGIFSNLQQNFFYTITWKLACSAWKCALSVYNWLYIDQDRVVPLWPTVPNFCHPPLSIRNIKYKLRFTNTIWKWEESVLAEVFNFSKKAPHPKLTNCFHPKRNDETSSGVPFLTTFRRLKSRDDSGSILPIHLPSPLNLYLNHLNLFMLRRLLIAGAHQKFHSKSGASELLRLWFWQRQRLKTPVFC